MAAKSKLVRPRDDRILFGVCAGIARYFGIDPAIIRIVAGVILFASGFLVAIFVYLLLAVIIPDGEAPVNQQIHATGEDGSNQAQDATGPYSQGIVQEKTGLKKSTKRILIIVGPTSAALALIGSFGALQVNTSLWLWDVFSLMMQIGFSGLGLTLVFYLISKRFWLVLLTLLVGAGLLVGGVLASIYLDEGTAFVLIVFGFIFLALGGFLFLVALLRQSRKQ